MSKPAAYVTAHEALALFMQGHAPPLDDAAMGKLVGVSRTGITKIRSKGRNPSLPLAASLENVTGIPACAWHPATPEQGKVSPSWLLLPEKPKRKAASKRLAAA